MLSRQQYDQARQSVGNGAGIFIWFLAWLLNGYFTVVALNEWGAWLLQGQDDARFSGMMALLGALLASPVGAWLIHISGSLVEGASWQSLHRGVGITFLLVLGCDIYTTVVGLQTIAEARDLPASGLAFLVMLAIAFTIALAPEHMIVRHLQELGVIRKQSRQVVKQTY